MSVETLSPAELAQQGEAAFRAKRYDEAARLFAAAERAYRQQGEALLADEMANNRGVALLQAGDAQGAYEAVAATVERFAQAGDRRRQALALGNRAAALEALGQLEAAEADYRAAAALLEELGEQELLVTVQQALAALLLRRQRPVEALNTLQTALADRPLTLRQRVMRRLIQWVYRLWGRPQ